MRRVAKRTPVRWRRVDLPTGHGETVPGWRVGEFIVCRNVNKGHSVTVGQRDRNGHRWWFEITRAGRGGAEVHVGEAPDRAGVLDIINTAQLDEVLS